MTPSAPSPFPTDGRRLVVYAFYNERGEVPDYVVRALEGLREHAARLIVVVNGSLDTDGRARLSGIADEVEFRANAGFDIGAHRHMLERLGSETADYDELLLTNDTWYGPVDSLGDTFERMDARAVDFWGMTEHGDETPNPLTGEGTLPAHLQSYWLAVRRSVLASEDWREYWAALAEPASYDDAVLRHEVPFTAHFAARGYVSEAAFPASLYPTPNASLFHADLLLDDGCPLIKRRPFFHGPWILDRHGVVDRRALDLTSRKGFPESVIVDDLTRRVEPRVVNVNAALLEVLPEDGGGFDASRALRVLVIAHIYYPEMTDEILDLVGNLPGGFDLVVTTTDEARAREIEVLAATRPPRGAVEIRVVENSGRDQGAFLIGCRDLLTSDRYDVVVKIHSKKTVQDGFAIGRHFKTQQYDNLLGSAGSASSLLALFQRHPSLGLAYPPTIHIGYPTLGKGWWANRRPAGRLLAKLGVRVPLDSITPLAPYGSMYAARPEALRRLVAHPWRYSDFGGTESYRDGGLAHVLERVPTYVAAEDGFHTRTVMTAEYAAVSHAALDYLLEEFRPLAPGVDDAAKIEFTRDAGHLGTGRLRDFARVYLRLHHPGLGARIRRALGPIVRIRRRILDRGIRDPF